MVTRRILPPFIIGDDTTVFIVNDARRSSVGGQDAAATERAL
jgi:hypothetical protein